MAHGRPRKTAMTGGGRYSVQSKSVRKLVTPLRSAAGSMVFYKLARMDAAGADWAGDPRGGSRTPARHDAPFVQEQDVSLPN